MKMEANRAKARIRDKDNQLAKESSEIDKSTRWKTGLFWIIMRRLSMWRV
jgi:hypothetical protein